MSAFFFTTASSFNASNYWYYWFSVSEACGKEQTINRRFQKNLRFFC